MSKVRLSRVDDSLISTFTRSVLIGTTVPPGYFFRQPKIANVFSGLRQFGSAEWLWCKAKRKDFSFRCEGSWKLRLLQAGRYVKTRAILVRTLRRDTNQ